MVIDEEFIKHLKGKSTFEEYLLLYTLVRLLKPKKILEIGTWKGASAIVMGKALQDMDIDGHIYTIEVHPELVKIAQDEIKKHGLSEIITVVHGRSEVEAKKFEDMDLIFIDGEHEYSQAKADWEAVKGHGKIYLFHDAFNPGPKRVLKEILMEGEYRVVFLDYPFGEIYHDGIAYQKYKGGFAIVESTNTDTKSAFGIIINRPPKYVER